MTVSVRKEIWAWKGINGVKKHISLIPLATFWVVQKERNMRAFEGKEVRFNSVKDIWFQNLGLFIKSHLLTLLRILGDLINILINM